MQAFFNKRAQAGLVALAVASFALAPLAEAAREGRGGGGGGGGGSNRAAPAGQAPARLPDRPPNMGRGGVSRGGGRGRGAAWGRGRSP